MRSHIFILFTCTILASLLPAEELIDQSGDASELYLLGEYELLSGNRDAAQTYFLQALALDSTSATIQISLADLAIEDKEYEAALPYLLKAAELEEDEVTLSRLLSLMFYLEKVEEARDFVLARIAEHPDSVLYWQKLSEVQLRLQDWIGLIDTQLTLYQLENQNPTYLEAVVQLGLGTGEYDRMMDGILGILNENPRDTQALGVYIRLLYAIGDEALIQSELARLSTIVLDKFAVMEQLAMFYELQGQTMESDSLFRIIIAEQPTDNNYNNYAYNICTRENVTEAELNYALELAGKALDLSPDNSAYLDTVGWIYLQMGEYDLADFFIRQSLEISDDNPVVLEHAGDVLVILNQREAAMTRYQQSLELDPSNTIVQEKLNRLVMNKP